MLESIPEGVLQIDAAGVIVAYPRTDGEVVNPKPAIDAAHAQGGIAVVVADTAGRWPDIRELTSSSMVYVRLHGNQELYVSGYDDSVLEEWAQTIRGWSSGGGSPDGRGRDVFVYFDNDVKVRAPYDAIRLRELLGLDPSPEEFRMLNPG